MKPLPRRVRPGDQLLWHPELQVEMEERHPGPFTAVDVSPGAVRVAEYLPYRWFHAAFFVRLSGVRYACPDCNRTGTTPASTKPQETVCRECWGPMDCVGFETEELG